MYMVPSGHGGRGVSVFDTDTRTKLAVGGADGRGSHMKGIAVGSQMLLVLLKPINVKRGRHFQIRIEIVISDVMLIGDIAGGNRQIANLAVLESSTAGDIVYHRRRTSAGIDLRRT